MLNETQQKFINMMQESYPEKYLYKNYYFFENTEVDPETNEETRTDYSNIVEVGDYILNNPGKVIKVITGWRGGIPSELMRYTISYDGSKINIVEEEN